MISTGAVAASADGSDYLAENVIPSYFALETQIFPEGGHVVRFDSFSKLLSAGLRLVSLAPYAHNRADGVRAMRPAHLISFTPLT